MFVATILGFKTNTNGKGIDCTGLYTVTICILLCIPWLSCTSNEAQYFA